MIIWFSGSGDILYPIPTLHPFQCDRPSSLVISLLSLSIIFSSVFSKFLNFLVYCIPLFSIPSTLFYSTLPFSPSSSTLLSFPLFYSTLLSSTPVLSPLFCSTLLLPVERARIDFKIRTRTRPWTGTAHTVSIQTIWTWMSRIKFLHEFCEQSVSKAYKCDEMCVKYSSLLYWLLFLLIVK